MKEYSALTDKEKFILELWDLYKDAYGFRPRHINFDSIQDDELEDLYKYICFKIEEST